MIRAGQCQALDTHSLGLRPAMTGNPLVWVCGPAVGCPGLAVTHPRPPFCLLTAKYIVQVDGKIGLFRGLSPRLMSNALSTVTRGSMKKVSGCPGSPQAPSLLGTACRPCPASCADPRTRWPLGSVLGRPPSLPPTAVAAVTLAFPLSAQCPSGPPAPEPHGAFVVRFSLQMRSSRFPTRMT